MGVPVTRIRGLRQRIGGGAASFKAEINCRSNNKYSERSGMTWTGFRSAMSSKTFFFPSQVVSPMMQSEKWKNGHSPDTAIP